MSRELDALVEQHIFGHEVYWSHDSWDGNQPRYKIPVEVIDSPFGPVSTGGEFAAGHYSESIALAWQVVEKMPGEPQIERNLGKWEVNTYINREWTEAVRDESVCRAICLAALKAAGVEA